jgi:hypothetical protein
MNAQEAVRGQLQFWHHTLQDMMKECNDEQLHRVLPGSTAGSIASIYAHTVLAEDFILHQMLQNTEMVFAAGGWEAKTGVPHTGRPMQTPEWAARVKMDLPAFQEYAGQIFAATDAWLASVGDDALEEKRQSPFGEQSVGFLVANLLGTHVPQHTGEIAALKGVQGLKGLPF